MQMCLPSIFTAYMGRYGGDTSIWTVPLSNIPSSDMKKDAASNIVSDSIADKPYFWIPTGIFVILWLLFQFFLFFKYLDLIISSTYFEINIKLGKFRLFWKFPSRYYDDPIIKNMVWKPDDPFDNYPFKATHILALLHCLFMVDTFLIKSNFKLCLFSILPYFESIILAFLHYETSLPRSTRKNLTNIVRDSYLPPGRRWLDNRPNPVYPAVHGDMNAFCAYNNDHPDCKDFHLNLTRNKPMVKELPNVVLITYESFTPSYDLITEEFVYEQAHIDENDPRMIITDTPYYNTKISPNLHRYQKDSITFSGMSSLGIPTASGFHGLLTGFLPSQTFNNIIDAGYLHSDDLPSYLHQYEYKNFFISPALLTFDGKANYVHRRSAHEEALNILKCKEAFGFLIEDEDHKALFGKNWPKMNEHCDPEEVARLEAKLKKEGKDFPKWYDFASDYMPSPENVHVLGIDPITLRLNASWPSDRLLSQIFRVHWNQARRYLKKNGKLNSNIFGHLMTVESHLPYKGYDLEEFYDKMNMTRFNINNDYRRDEKFRRNNKFCDKWAIGAVLDELKKNDPNTIFIITGDHGTRDIPVRDSDMPLYKDVVFSSDCVHHSSGTDSFYVVSGMIGYLGDDPVIRDVLGLDKLAGKTLKIPTDHSDITYTVEDIIAKLNGSYVSPTHRRSRNLIDLSLNITNALEKGKDDKDIVKKIYDEIDKSRWSSASLTTFNIEYREGSKLLRSHPGNKYGSHFYQHASYPMCFRQKNKKPMKLGIQKDKTIFDRAFQYISVANHLQYSNRIYNNGFRDLECIKKGKCEFKDPTPMKNHDYFFRDILLLIPVLFLVVFGIIPEIIIFIYLKITDYLIYLEMEEQSDDLREKIDFMEVHTTSDSLVSEDDFASNNP